jgi:BlaI family penicillinase repressor
MKEMPRISEAEWEVMKVLWESSLITANEIVEKLEGQVSWKPKTVKTLINRLLKKNAIAFEKDDRTYRYYPIISKEDCIREESQSFLKRVYNGELNVMLTSFLSSRQLSEKDRIEGQNLRRHQAGPPPGSGLAGELHPGGNPQAHRRFAATPAGRLP